MGVETGRVFWGSTRPRRFTMPSSPAALPPSNVLAAPRPHRGRSSPPPLPRPVATRVAARLLILPSADSRRVLEEMVPTFPAELGGGPMTDLTHGMIWAALGLEAGPQPSLRLVAESKDASAAKSLERLAHNGSAYLGQMPDLKKLVPELPRILGRHEARSGR